MRNRLYLYPLFGILSLLLLYSCRAPEVSVVSCTSQVYYPGRQEVQPYQEIIVKTNKLDESVQLDSLTYGNQTVLLRPNQQMYYGQAEGTTFSQKATLYYSSKKKSYSLEIDSIAKLDPLHLP